MGFRARKLGVTQETASSYRFARSCAPVAMRLQQLFAAPALPHVQLCRKYITRTGLLGTLMRHYFFLPLTLAIASCAPSMGKPPRTAVLIAPTSFALRRAARLLAALGCTVALPSIALAAHQHFDLAVRTGEHSPTQEQNSRHRNSA